MSDYHFISGLRYLIVAQRYSTYRRSNIYLPISGERESVIDCNRDVAIPVVPSTVWIPNSRLSSRITEPTQGIQYKVNELDMKKKISNIHLTDLMTSLLIGEPVLGGGYSDFGFVI